MSSKKLRTNKKGGGLSRERDPIHLERILGINALSCCGISSNQSGDIFYGAGCFVISYNVDSNRQTRFFKCNKAISCLTLSPDGNFLAIGERGHLPSVIVYDIISGEMVATLNGHKHGIGCLAFSSDGHNLVSVGFKHDRQLILWEWATEKKVSVQNINNKVNSVSFDTNSQYFVTCGDRHMKWWYLVRGAGGEPISLSGKPATILEAHAGCNFVDVKCGSGENSNKIFSTTSSGILCTFQESRVMDKWVKLDSIASYSLSITNDLLAIGCSNGTIRLFSPTTLKYITTLPLPAPLSNNIKNSSHSQLAQRYPACYNVNILPNSDGKVACIYSDHSIYIWDILDVLNISRYRSFQFHRACIWDLQFIDSSLFSPTTVQSSRDNNEYLVDDSGTALPPGTFVTCSADNSISFWNIDPKLQRQSKWKSSYSREMLHRIDLSNSVEDDTEDTDGGGVTSSTSSIPYNSRNSDNRSEILDLSTGFPDTELPDRPSSNCTPRSLAVHPFANEIICGDKRGRLRVFNLNKMLQTHCLLAHDAEVLALHYSPPLRIRPNTSTGDSGDGSHISSIKDTTSAAIWEVDLTNHTERSDTDSESSSSNQKNSLVLLASAGRDRLIHILNASQDYQPVTVLDDHSSSVTALKFSSDGKRLISCGGDKTMVFSEVNGDSIRRFKSVQTPNGTINGLAAVGTSKFLVTSGQDRRVNIWNIHTGKHLRAYKHESVTGELYKCDVDPSGMFVATCAFDKSIRLFDYFSGDIIAQVSGHSELITSVKFSTDGKYLISVGGDGCIFVWKLGIELVTAMQDRLLELLASAQKAPSKITTQDQKNAAIDVQKGPPLTNKVNSNNINNSSVLPTPPKTSSQIVKGSSKKSTHSSVLPDPEDSTAKWAKHRIPDKGNSNAVKSEVARPSTAATATATAANQDGSNHRPLDRASGNHRPRTSSKWSDRVAESGGGYELFGQKIQVLPKDKNSDHSHRNRHKLTLELTTGAASELVATKTEVEKGVGVTIDSRTKIATTIEGEDSVRLGDVGSSLGQFSEYAMSGNINLTSGVGVEDGNQEYEQDFELDEAPAYDDDDEEDDNDDLNRASERIDSLDHSAQAIENWLDMKLRTDNYLDDEIQFHKIEEDDKDVSKGSSSVERSKGKIKNNNFLSNSLSSAFFQDLKIMQGDHHLPQSSGIKSSINPENIDTTGDNFLPPVPNQSEEEEDDEEGEEESAPSYSAVQLLDEKRQETAMAVMLMRERLRAMGIYGGGSSSNSNNGEVKSSSVGDHVSKDKDDEVELEDYNDDETASTVSGSDKDKYEFEQYEDDSEEKEESGGEGATGEEALRLISAVPPLPPSPATEAYTAKLLLSKKTVNEVIPTAPTPPKQRTVVTDKLTVDTTASIAVPMVKNSLFHATKEDDKEEEGIFSDSMKIRKSELIKQHIQMCRCSLSDLAAASRKALEAYSTLASIRQSIESDNIDDLRSIDKGNSQIAGNKLPNSNSNNKDVTVAQGNINNISVAEKIEEEEAIKEADELLLDFDQSWCNLAINAVSSEYGSQSIGNETANELSTSQGNFIPSSYRTNYKSLSRNLIKVAEERDLKDTSVSTVKSASFGSSNYHDLSEVQISTILEKYSDQLMNLVSDKIASKIVGKQLS